MARSCLSRSRRSIKRKAPDTAEGSPTKMCSPPKKSQSVRPFVVQGQFGGFVVLLRFPSFKFDGSGHRSADDQAPHEIFPPRRAEEPDADDDSEHTRPQRSH